MRGFSNKLIIIYFESLPSFVPLLLQLPIDLISQVPKTSCLDISWQLFFHLRQFEDGSTNGRLSGKENGQMKASSKS